MITVTAAELQMQVLVHKSGIVRILHDLKRMSAAKKRRLLGSHLLHSYRDGDVEFRSQVDVAVGTLGLVELGLMFGAVAGSPGPVVRKFLADEDIQRYAFVFYPQLLPRLLARRLEGPAAVAEGAFADQEAWLQVQQLNSRREQHEIQLFLDLADDISFGELNRSSFLECISNPKSLTKTLTREAEDEEYSETAAVFGLIDFLHWTEDVAALLADVRDPFAKSAVWHHFSYWFGLTGGLMYGVLSTSLEAIRSTFERIGSKAGRRDLDATEIHRHLETLRHMTSHRFGAALESLEGSGMTIPVAGKIIADLPEGRVRSEAEMAALIQDFLDLSHSSDAWKEALKEAAAKAGTDGLVRFKSLIDRHGTGRSVGDDTPSMDPAAKAAAAKGIFRRS